MKRLLAGLVAAFAALALSACATSGSSAEGDRPSVVVTTNILGDVVSQVVGDQAEVTVLMPPNADPHAFGVSAQEALKMQQADLLVYNGQGLEEDLIKHVDAAGKEGVTLFAATDYVDLLDYSTADASGPDPHFWTDPTQMIKVVEALKGELSKVEGIDPAAIAASAEAYRDQLAGADADMEAAFSPIPANKRALVTNHHVFGYLARRYDFTVIGAVIPGGATLAAPSAADLSELAEAVRTAGVGAIFADVSSPDKLVQSLAAHTGVDVQVVPLFTESLSEPGGEAPTYLDMLRVNSTRIAEALR
ncbi:MAG: zinc ABC transporter substrate-binding protein AztC [Buchananella hordeovulneris]|nr:zinc ABC transporter substrate-binding protein AztC [Buchananella hordeovulneris]